MIRAGNKGTRFHVKFLFFFFIILFLIFSFFCIFSSISLLILFLFSLKLLYGSLFILFSFLFIIKTFSLYIFDFTFTRFVNRRLFSTLLRDAPHLLPLPLHILVDFITLSYFISSFSYFISLFFILYVFA